MPEVSTSAGGLGAFGGFVQGLGNLVTAVSPILQPIIQASFPTAQFQGQFQDPRFAAVPRSQPIALPGGAPILGVNQAGLGQEFLDFTGLGGMLGIGGGNLPIQPTTSVTTRFPRTVSFTTQTPSGNPKVITYRNMGSCLLFSGDLSAAKRVKRIASKARRRLGGR